MWLECILFHMRNALPPACRCEGLSRVYASRKCDNFSLAARRRVLCSLDSACAGIIGVSNQCAAAQLPLTRDLNNAVSISIIELNII